LYEEDLCTPIASPVVTGGWFEEDGTEVVTEEASCTEEGNEVDTSALEAERDSDASSEYAGGASVKSLPNAPQAPVSLRIGGCL